MEQEAKNNESDADIVIEEIVDEEISETIENDESVAETSESIPETPQEEIEKQRMEKVFKKQEEEWINKKEKVSLCSFCLILMTAYHDLVPQLLY